MKNSLIIFLFFFTLAFGQTQRFSISNSIFLPIYQQSELAFSNYESGNIRLLPSSYFAGITYEHDLKDKLWSLRGGMCVGFEHYSITTYNEFIDFNAHPELAIDFEGFESQHQTYVLSLGIARNFYCKRFLDEISVNTGLYLNQSFQLHYSKSFEIQSNTLEIDGEYYLPYTKVTIPSVSKFGMGVDFGIQLRKYIFGPFYLELSGKCLLRNQLDYSYDLLYTMNSNAGYQQYTSYNQRNKIQYGLMCVQLNLGYQW